MRRTAAEDQAKRDPTLELARNHDRDFAIGEGVLDEAGRDQQAVGLSCKREPTWTGIGPAIWRKIVQTLCRFR